MRKLSLRYKNSYQSRIQIFLRYMPVEHSPKRQSSLSLSTCLSNCSGAVECLRVEGRRGDWGAGAGAERYCDFKTQLVLFSHVCLIRKRILFSNCFAATMAYKYN